MALNISNNGVGLICGTYEIEDSTWNKIKGDTNSAMNKAVTLVGDNMVGFGDSAGSPLFGIMQVIETRKTASVAIIGVVEGVPVGSTPPTVGIGGVGVDANGKVIALSGATRGVVTAVPSGEDVAHIQL